MHKALCCHLGVVTCLTCLLTCYHQVGLSPSKSGVRCSVAQEMNAVSCLHLLHFYFAISASPNVWGPLEQRGKISQFHLFQIFIFHGLVCLVFKVLCIIATSWIGSGQRRKLRRGGQNWIIFLVLTVLLVMNTRRAEGNLPAQLGVHPRRGPRVVWPHGVEGVEAQGVTQLVRQPGRDGQPMHWLLLDSPYHLGLHPGVLQDLL